MHSAPLARRMLLGVPLLCLAPGSDSAAASADEAAVIVQVLMDPELSDAQRLRAVSELGPGACRAVFELFTGRIDTSTLPLEGPLLDEARRALLVEATRGWPESEALAAMTVRAEDWSFQELMIGVDYLAEFGGAPSMAFVAARLGAMEPVELHSPALARRIAPAFAALLARDPGAFRFLEDLVDTAPAPLLPVLADVLAGTGGSGAFAILERLLGRSVELDLCVLEAVGKLDRFDTEVPADRRAWLLRRYVNAQDPRLQRNAMTALGRLRDVESVPDMLAGLDEGRDPRVRRAAHWAIQETTGLGWRLDVERWQRWYEGEEAWYETSFGELTLRITSDDPAVAFDALRHLALHPLYRAEMIETVARALSHESPGVARAACGILVRLDDPGAIEPLIVALADPRPEIGRAAQGALQALTGQELPADPRAWEDWLDAR